MATRAPKIPLPKDWSSHVKTAILHVISLARASLAAARSRAATSRKLYTRLRSVAKKPKFVDIRRLLGR